MAAEAAISSAVELMGDLLIEKVKSLQGVEGKVRSLKEELKRMRSFLKDANQKQYKENMVRNWISEIREVAEDAEDTIEMFLVNVESARKRSDLKRCTSCPKRIYHIDRIGNDIESIRTRLDAIDKSRERYGIRILPEAAAAAEDSTVISPVELRRRLPPWKKDEDLVSIEDDVEKVLRVSILDQEKKGFSAAVLRGMGGIGKSTLAREIYNHPDLHGKFECYAWIVVSSEFTPQETIKQLIIRVLRYEEEERKEEVTRKLLEAEETTKDKVYSLLEKLQELLHEQLQKKTYFIVLDDVWEQEPWACLKSAFPNQEDKPSRLLVTTRNKIIIKPDQYEHEMKGLGPEKGWELLMKKALIGSTNGECPKHLESIGRQILEKCCGLPLAISVVGGLLTETQTQSGWEDVLNQINVCESDVYAILELSYQNLSPQLKPCFLCLAIFKEDSTIPAQRLVYIWAAQGLIRWEGSRSINEIGRGYLNKLINRSLFQIEDLGLDDRVRNCRLHDLLRDMCLRKAEEEMSLRNVSATSAHASSYKTRHGVVYGAKNLRSAFSPEETRHLRSLFLRDFIVRIPSRYWKRFQLLKTLDLDGFGLRKLPKSFRFLVVLKYLRIGRNFRVLKLPGWFDRLKKLEIFETDLVTFPYGPLEMESLRHFRAVVMIGVKSINNWKSIETLTGIGLEDLLRISSTGAANFSHLHELGIVIHSEGDADVVSRVIACVKKMTNLVELQVRSCACTCSV